MTQNRPLFAGRVLVFVGLMVVALNIRTAVAALGPLVTLIRESYELTNASVSIIGAIAPASFVLASLTVPSIARRIGLNTAVIASLALIIAGHLLRGFSTDWITLALGSFVVLFGSGAGNVVMPPLVKKYFPDRIGLLTAAYMTVAIFFSGVPPFVALPVAQATSWQFSLGEWAILGLVALWPWLVINMREKKTAGSNAPQGTIASAEPVPPPLPLRKSPTAWAIGLVFAVGSTTTYAMFAWLPTIAVDMAGVDYAQGGAMVALYTDMAIPSAILIPIIAARTKRVDFLIHTGVILFLIGFAGFILFPTQAPWVWVTILGAAPILFPLAVVLINLRTESQHASLQLSGFAQAIAYSCAALSPLMMGFTFELTGTWVVGLVILAAFSSTASIAAFIIERGRTVEQDLRA